MQSFALHAPRSLEEATHLLAHYAGEARPIAGGTALVLMLRHGLVRPPALVRLDFLAELQGIAREDGTVRLGAMATLRSVADSPLVDQHLPMLGGVCGLVGNVRVRNAATIGGNVCEADYASDPPAVLVALDARARVRGPTGTREVAVSNLITDFYETSLAPDELITDVVVPIPPSGTRAAYLKYLTRSSEDRPCVGVAAMIRTEDGRVADLRVAIGAVAGAPLRLREAERGAFGEAPTEELFRHLGDLYGAAADPVADSRGSSAYRKRVIPVLVRRVLERALQGGPAAEKC